MADNKNGHPSTMIKSIKMIAHNGWMIVKVFSPPVHNTILRLLALWCFVTYVIIVFLFTLLLMTVAQFLPFLKTEFIHLILLMIPEDPAFHHDYVKHVIQPW